MDSHRATDFGIRSAPSAWPMPTIDSNAQTQNISGRQPGRSPSARLSTPQAPSAPAPSPEEVPTSTRPASRVSSPSRRAGQAVMVAEPASSKNNKRRSSSLSASHRITVGDAPRRPRPPGTAPAPQVEEPTREIPTELPSLPDTPEATQRVIGGTETSQNLFEEDPSILQRLGLIEKRLNKNRGTINQLQQNCGSGST